METRKMVFQQPSLVLGNPSFTLSGISSSIGTLGPPPFPQPSRPSKTFSASLLTVRLSLTSIP